MEYVNLSCKSHTIKLNIQPLFLTLIIPALCLINPLISIIYTYFLVLYFIVKNNCYSFLFFIYFCFFQNITLIVFANSFTQLYTTLFSLSKEIMLYGILLTNLLNFRKKVYNLLLFLAFLLVLILSFFISNSDFYSKILTIRQLLLPFVCFYFGYYVKANSKDLKVIFKTIVNLCIITAIIGLIEFFLMKDFFWHMVPIDKYEINKGTTFVFYNGVPLNFYTFDFVDIIGTPLHRLVSHFGDPLITAHYLFLGFCLCDIVYDNKSRKFLKILLFVSSILTLCKGLIICYFIYFIVKMLKKIKSSMIKKRLIMTLIAFAITFFLAYIISNKFLPNSSIVIHINGFINGIIGVGLIGNGIGTAGVITGVVSGNEISAASESFLGVLSYQLGYIGLLIYILFFAFIIIKYLYLKSNNYLKIFNIALTLTCSIFFESFLSESSVGIVATGLYFIISGCILNFWRSNYENNSNYSNV